MFGLRVNTEIALGLDAAISMNVDLEFRVALGGHGFEVPLVWACVTDQIVPCGPRHGRGFRRTEGRIAMSMLLIMLGPAMTRVVHLTASDSDPPHLDFGRLLVAFDLNVVVLLNLGHRPV